MLINVPLPPPPHIQTHTQSTKLVLRNHFLIKKEKKVREVVGIRHIISYQNCDLVLIKHFSKAQQSLQIYHFLVLMIHIIRERRHII